MGIFENAILFCDIDGTLLENGIIPERNIEKIEFFINEGGKVSLATGRHFSANYDIVETINGLSLAVATNGTIVYDYVNKNIIFEEIMPKCDYHFVLDVINSGYDFGIEVYAGEKLYTLNKNEKTDEHQESQHLVSDVLSYDEAINYNWNKVLYMLNNEEDYEKIISLTSSCESGCDFIKTCTYIKSNKRYYFEQMPKNVSKDIAMKKLCEILKIEKGKCFAIGDYYNDYTMLKNADISAATAEAPDEIKQVSNFVGGACKNGAVADFIDYLTEIFKN